MIPQISRLYNGYKTFESENRRLQSENRRLEKELLELALDPTPIDLANLRMSLPKTISGIEAHYSSESGLYVFEDHIEHAHMVIGVRGLEGRLPIFRQA